jgi:hypothetical protein
MKSVEVTVKGISPLLMHRNPIEPVEMIEKKTREEQAEIAAYRVPGTNELYIAGSSIQSALVVGAVYSKGKGRASLQKQTAACVMVTPEYAGLGKKEYLIDTRWVVNPSTRGRVLRHRPRLDDWEVSFRIDYDDTLLTEVELRKIVDDTCQRVGFLDFRPAKKGPFGRSVVVHWDNGKKKKAS